MTGRRGVVGHRAIAARQVREQRDHRRGDTNVQRTVLHFLAVAHDSLSVRSVQSKPRSTPRPCASRVWIWLGDAPLATHPHAARVKLDLLFTFQVTSLWGTLNTRAAPLFHLPGLPFDSPVIWGGLAQATLWQDGVAEHCVSFGVRGELKRSLHRLQVHPDRRSVTHPVHMLLSRVEGVL